MNKTIEEDLKAKIVELEKWIELYKAQADGKVIQQAHPDELTGGCLTSSWGEFISFEYPIQCYRIKPDEPKPEFKVGHMVRDTKTNDIFILSDAHIANHFDDKSYLADCIFWVPAVGDYVEYDCSSPILLTEENLAEYNQSEVQLRPSKKPKFKVGDWIKYIDDGEVFKVEKRDSNYYLHYRDTYVHESGCELWQPQEGNVVVCWSKNYEMDCCIRFIFKPEDKDMLAVYSNDGCSYVELEDLTHIIPYIGQDLKDMK